jgi:hypothetical protein
MPFDADFPWLLSLLAVVRTRPAMWVPGPETVENLQSYLNGYRQARGDLGIPEYGAGDETILDEFTSWLKQHIGSDKTLNWADYVQEVDPGAKNVYTFFNLFEQFLISQGRRFPLPQGAGWPADEWGIPGNSKMVPSTTARRSRAVRRKTSGRRK